MVRNKGRWGKSGSSFLLLALPLITVLAGGVIYRYGYMGIQSQASEIREAQAQKMNTLRRQIALISKRGYLEREQRTLAEERIAEEKRFIDGATVTLAQSSLQQLVKGIIVGKGGAVSAENIGKPQDTGEVTIISETLDSTYPDIKAFLDAICALETETPYMSVGEST